MPVKSHAKVFDEDYQEQPGNDYAQRDKDSVMWDQNNTVKMTPLGYCSGPQVGPLHSADGLGQKPSMITYETASGKGVRPSTKRGG